MGEALRNITVRGKCLVFVGITLALLAFLLGEKDLLRAGLLIGILPALSALYLARAKYQMTASRTLNPGRVEIGQQANVTLRVRNHSRVSSGTMMLEDRLPYALGTRPRLVLERLAAGAGSAVTYTAHAEQRGRYDVGPLVLRLTDPFGLVELTRLSPNTDHLTVTPKIFRLPAIRLPGEYAGRGDNHSQAVAVHGEDDAATREYRHGDDLRRVHWPSTARTGELMVRREEQPWDSRATVLLDIRSSGHHGEGPTSSFEMAVSTAASVNQHLRATGYKRRLVTETDDLEPDVAGDGSVLDYLAGVRAARHGDMARLVDRVRQRDHGGLIIATVGTLSRTEAEQLGALRTSGATCIAVLIDSTTWLRLSDAARQDADEEFRATNLTLLRSGWRVLPIRHGDDIAQQWRGLTQGPQGFAYRAAMAETVAGSHG